MQTSFMGEFGYELLGVLPYAYWLHQQGQLIKTISATDTKPFYYFSPNHQELPGRRHRGGEKIFTYSDIRKLHPPTNKWMPPPYKEVYQNDKFLFDKPLCIVTNKYVMWPGVGIVNFLDLETLQKLFVELLPNYQVVYCRAVAKNITLDHLDLLEFLDLELVKNNFPEVLLIQDLHTQNPELSFNRLQLKVFANCKNFISAQGGYSSLSSYFGGRNIIFATYGYEVLDDAFNHWYPCLSGTEITHVKTYEDMLNEVKKWKYI